MNKPNANGDFTNIDEAMVYLIKAYASPGISISQTATELGVSWATARRHLSRLVKMGLLKEIRDGSTNASPRSHHCTDRGVEVLRHHRYIDGQEPGDQHAPEAPQAEPETGIQRTLDWEPEMLLRVLRCDAGMHHEGTVVCVDCNIEQITDQVPYRTAAVKAAAIVHGIDPDRLLGTLDSIEAMMEAN